MLCWIRVIKGIVLSKAEMLFLGAREVGEELLSCILATTVMVTEVSAHVAHADDAEDFIAGVGGEGLDERKTIRRDGEHGDGTVDLRVRGCHHPCRRCRHCLRVR